MAIFHLAICFHSTTPFTQPLLSLGHFFHLANFFHLAPSHRRPPPSKCSSALAHCGRPLKAATGQVPQRANPLKKPTKRPAVQVLRRSNSLQAATEAHHQGNAPVRSPTVGTHRKTPLSERFSGLVHCRHPLKDTTEQRLQRSYPLKEPTKLRTVQRFQRSAPTERDRRGIASAARTRLSTRTVKPYQCSHCAPARQKSAAAPGERPPARRPRAQFHLFPPPPPPPPWAAPEPAGDARAGKAPLREPTNSSTPCAPGNPQRPPSIPEHPSKVPPLQEGGRLEKSRRIGLTLSRS